MLEHCELLGKGCADFGVVIWKPLSVGFRSPTRSVYSPLKTLFQVPNPFARVFGLQGSVSHS